MADADDVPTADGGVVASGVHVFTNTCKYDDTAWADNFLNLAGTLTFYGW